MTPSGTDWPSMGRFLPALAICLPLLAACASASPPPSSITRVGPLLPTLNDNKVVTADGHMLPLHRWGPETPDGVILALHGFNDHGGVFATLGEALAAHGIALYAHDHRGFGAAEQPGHWAGHAVMANDARTVLELLDERYADQTPHLLGKSMGGAVAVLALTPSDEAEEPPATAGTILVAPAVWGRDQMPWYQRLSLWVGSRLAPHLVLSGEMAADLGIRPTDDPEVIAAMQRDPLVRHSASLRQLDGITTLMSAAQQRADSLPTPGLILYGDRDDLVPPMAMAALLRQLQPVPGYRAVLYPDGYHMLTRYTRAERTFEDIAAWVRDPQAALPSGHERNLAALIEYLDTQEHRRGGE